MDLTQKYGQTRVLFVIYGIAYVYSIHFAPFLAKHAPTSSWNQIHERCYRDAPPMLKGLLSARGTQYIIGDESQSASLENCLLTFWGTSHGLLYLILGYLCPKLFWPTFWIGVGFEVYEKLQYDCADPLDIVWNTMGFMIGRYVST